jgi:23S rRNA pseudouridine2605 synthase
MSKKISLATYLAHAGICSRRKADGLVRQGLVTLNGQVVCEPGTPVLPQDLVCYAGQLVKLESKIYILLNKPAGYLSAVSDDEHGRKTVLDLVEGACDERLYPVGRLDYQTTGLIVLTNDGDFAQRLAHPSYEVVKIYQAILNRDLKTSDLNAIYNGVPLEDGFMQVDDIFYANQHDDRNIIVVIHSGKKRVVRRLFEHVGYEVLALDRVQYAGLTKQDLKVGQWRFLTPQEVANLKKT